MRCVCSKEPFFIMGRIRESSHSSISHVLAQMFFVVFSRLTLSILGNVLGFLLPIELFHNQLF